QGRYASACRPRVLSERRSAALSSATNRAVAQASSAHGTGSFRVMAGPDDKAVARLRQTASASALGWPAAMPSAQFEKTLDPAQPRQAAFMMAVRRAGNGAGYAPLQPGVPPWHSAIAASYVHATAPLRRSADRYVIRAALAVCHGDPVPEAVTRAFAASPEVMARADASAGRIERGVIDSAETVMSRDRTGERFDAVVTDSEGDSARIQLAGSPVVARVRAAGVLPGTRIMVRSDQADSANGRSAFSSAS
ncbi:hypothetical protein OY671_008685, partial [Metschnikowia pulcherrima]